MSEVKTKPPAHVEGGRYHKNCLHCSTAFQSNSRNTRFCGDVAKQCQKRYSKARHKRRKAYRTNQLSCIIWTQAHKLARLVMEREVKEGRKTGKCERCETAGTVTDSDPIQVNHVDGNHLNANPSNLENCCDTHHRQADSERKLREKADAKALAANCDL